jgi:putative ABC transport system permease protein
VSTNRAPRAYRLLLAVFAPRRIRHRYGSDMAEMFAERLSEARQLGRASALAVWAAATCDLLFARARQPFRRRAPVLDVPHTREAIMMRSDLKYTCRWLWRQKSSTALVIAMLALGIAANVVVFSLISALFLRPFPFSESDRLVYINETAPRWNLDIVGINYPDFHQWRQGMRLFDGIAIFDERSFNLSDGEGAERIQGAGVTSAWASVLRLQPILGRMFTEDEDRPKSQAVMVISEGLWRERFGGRPDALGKTLKLNGVAHTIVGVMPANAEFPGGVRLWVPYAGDPAQPYQSYGSSGAIGRLKPGVSVADAEHDLIRAHQPVWDARDNDHTVSPFVRDLRQQFARNFRTQAKTLAAAVAILLVIACANVASVMLARALARRREMGIRLAVGASRARLARQLFLENLLLASAGGALGLFAGRWALYALLATAGNQVPPWANFGLDVRVIGFSVLLCIATTVLFGWAPALHAIRGDLRAAMHDAATASTTGPGGRRTLSLLVGAEFALAAVLLVCGGLLFRAYDRVRHVDPGFRADHVLTFMVALPQATYAEDEKQLAFWNRLLDHVRGLSGVEAAGLVSCPPLGCHWGTFYDIEGRAPLRPGEANPVVLYRPATPGYFEAMGVRLLSGRFFTDHDSTKSQPVAIVNQTFAKTFWPGVTNPVGRRFRGNGKDAPWITVVGFAADVKHYGLEVPMRPGIYRPLAQAASDTMTMAIRTTGDPAAFTPAARTAVGDIDRDLAMYQVRTMEDALRRSMSERTLYSWLLAVFAGMALLLALGGTYGVTSYLVSQRMREIGIRVALGARTADITRTVLLGSLGIVVIGIIVGVAGATGIARVMSDLLFGVAVYDARVLTFAVAVLVAFATAANALPARRAARIDPMRTLRGD